VSWRFESPHAPLTLAGRLVGILGAIVKIAVWPIFGTQPDPPLHRTMLYSLSVTITRGTYVNPLSRFRKHFLAAFLPLRLPLSPDGRRSISLRERGLAEVRAHDARGGSSHPVRPNDACLRLDPSPNMSAHMHSVASFVRDRTALVTTRSCHAPHLTISDVSLIGGGPLPRPGEVSLAPHGILFLDELPEFRRHVLEVLRQTLKDSLT
jgi:hypothetical protein